MRDTLKRFHASVTEEGTPESIRVLLSVYRALSGGHEDEIKLELTEEQADRLARHLRVSVKHTKNLREELSFDDTAPDESL